MTLFLLHSYSSVPSFSVLFPPSSISILIFIITIAATIYWGLTVSQTPS